jgi:hypothetical protein
MKKNKDAFILTMNISEIEKKLEKSGAFKKKNINSQGNIKQSLNNLPQHVWMNPHLKWLYISNGIGYFPMLVYERLLEKMPLSHNIEYNNENGYHNTEGKKKWILNNMIFIIETNTQNVTLYKKILGKNTNISTTDFIDSNNRWKLDFNGIETFDIIMCNPPININNNNINIKHDTELYLKYIKKSLLITKKLLFLIPNYWTSDSDEISQLKKNIISTQNFNLYNLFFKR